MTAAPSGGRVAWLMKERGANNLWVAAAPDYKGRRLTSITEDDGQEIGEVTWTADGKSIVYVRGGDLETNGDNPNPELAGLFLYLNTNKTGVTLNLDSLTGREIFKKLISDADILG